MKLDGNRYAVETGEKLNFEVCSVKTRTINENSGFDIVYQKNKEENLKITAKTMNGVLIRPGEIFSFCLLSKNAGKYGKLKEGLILTDGKITARKGGGTCHLSNMLYQMFLMSPLTVIERHSHKVKSFPDPDGCELDGIDATISEGWLDLKVKNNTENTYQIQIYFDDKYMYGQLLSDCESDSRYDIINENTRYASENGNTYKYTTVARIKKERGGEKVLCKEKLYDEKILIEYKQLPA